jgi:branched-chain amino acid transport system substrate-binding protein
VLDDSSPKTGLWDPALASANASQAAQDERTIAYVGDFDSDASAIALPLLNEVGILQVSGASTSIDLTRATPAVPGSPLKYYPNMARVGRTFGRVVPQDMVQASAQLELMQREHVRRAYVLDDGQTVDEGLADALAQAAPAHGIAVVRGASMDPEAADYRDLANTIATSGVDAVFFAGAPGDPSVRFWRELAVADTDLRLFACSRLAAPSFLTGLGTAAARSTLIALPTLPEASYPRTGRRLLTAFHAAYGAQPAPGAIFGYEAMSVTLDAIRRAEATVGKHALTRAAVVRAFFATRDRASVLGTYSIDANGDTTLTRFAAYAPVAGRLRLRALLPGTP